MHYGSCFPLIQIKNSKINHTFDKMCHLKCRSKDSDDGNKHYLSVPNKQGGLNEREGGQR